MRVSRLALLIVTLTAVRAWAKDTPPETSPAFTALRPLKTGLWEHTITSTAQAPKNESLQDLPKASIPLWGYASNANGNREPTVITEKICWTDTMFDQTQYNNIQAALLNTGPEGLCNVRESNHGETIVTCPLDERYTFNHSYQQQIIDGDNFSAREIYSITRKISPAATAESIFDYRFNVTSHWLGADCETNKKK